MLICAHKVLFLGFNTLFDFLSHTFQFVFVNVLSKVKNDVLYDGNIHPACVRRSCVNHRYVFVFDENSVKTLRISRAKPQLVIESERLCFLRDFFEQRRFARAASALQ